MFLLASCEVISVGGQYKRRNKPPKVARQGGLTSCPRSVAMNSLGAGTDGETSAARIPFLWQCEELFRCLLGQREQQVLSTGKLVLCLNGWGMHVCL